MANYNNYNKGIRETSEYLELFLRNLLLGENNELKNRYTHVRWKKQDIEEQKQDIETPKQDIEIPEAFSNKTKQHIQILFAEFGNDKFFGRTEVMKPLMPFGSNAGTGLMIRMIPERASINI